MTALWIILFIIGVPIVVVFWIVVALIIVAVRDNQKGSRHLRQLNSASNANKTKGRKRQVKQTIMRLR